MTNPVIFETVLVLTILTVIQSLLITNWNTCSSDSSSFWITYGVSFMHCFRGCQIIDSCQTVSYHRHAHKCILFHRELTPTFPLKECNVNVVVARNDFPKMVKDMTIGPVLDMNQIPGCTFVKNVDADSVAVSCSAGGKLSIYTRQADGQVANHVTAFRGISGNGYDPYEDWLAGNDVTHHKTCENLQTCSKHFRHYIVEWWAELDIKEIKISFKLNRAEVAFMVFGGQGHDLDSWFVPSNVLRSSWRDLSSHQSFQSFSMQGVESINRRFFVCVLYNGCPGDLVYFLVLGKVPGSDSCWWDKHGKTPQFLYAHGDVVVPAKDISWADTMEIELYF